MFVIDAYWTEKVNYVVILCDACGHMFKWPTSIMVAECDKCNNKEVWDGVDLSGTQYGKYNKSKIVVK